MPLLSPKSVRGLLDSYEGSGVKALHHLIVLRVWLVGTKAYSTALEGLSTEQH